MPVTPLDEFAGMLSCWPRCYLSNWGRGAGVAGWSAVGGASQGTFLVGFLPTSLLQGNLKREEGMAGMVVCSARAAGGVVSAIPK